MRLSGKRLGTWTAFVDSPTDEVILQVASDNEDVLRLSFRLYDARGHLIAEADGLEHPPQGFSIRGADSELLLEVPGDRNQSIRYRLYNRDGHILTCSDGKRTTIYPNLRMVGGRSR